MTHHMKLVKQNRRLGGMLLGRVSKGLPHVHDRQSDSLALLRPQSRKEETQTRLRTVLAPKPNRPLPLQVADHNAVIVAFPNRNLVEAYHLRPRGPHATYLLPQVLHLQGLDRSPIKMQFFGYVPNTRISATTAHVTKNTSGT